MCTTCSKNSDSMSNSLATLDLLELQSLGSRAVRDFLDLAVIDVAAAVEDDLRDALRLGPLGHRLPDQPRRLAGRRPALELALDRLLAGVGLGQGAAREVVDHLGVGVLLALVDRQARSLRGAVDPLAQPLVGARAAPVLLLQITHLASLRSNAGLLGPGLADLAPQHLVGVLDALALVGVGPAQAADLRRRLPDQVAVRSGDRHPVGLAVHLDLDPRRDREDDRVGIAERELHGVALDLGLVAHADDLEGLREALGGAAHRVGVERARQAVPRPLRPGLAAAGHLDDPVLELQVGARDQRLRDLALRPLDVQRPLAHLGLDALGDLDRLPAYSRHRPLLTRPRTPPRRRAGARAPGCR